MNNKIKNSFLITIGFLLSPLSWWNDIIINIPLAYIFSFPFSFISEKLFLPSFIAGYFLTNLAGFIMMHKGVNGLKDKPEHNNKKEIIKDILISLAYMLLIIILVLTGILKAPTEYLSYFR